MWCGCIKRYKGVDHVSEWMYKGVDLISVWMYKGVDHVSVWMYKGVVLKLIIKC